ncbi:MAG: hypothetical protein BWK76_09890 [Desulfobulbaceae bacterium A2]|nr:MAG: hypothetical protein BWK76_09890 [Desulfobulbaceae bacterium A2]
MSKPGKHTKKHQGGKQGAVGPAGRTGGEGRHAAGAGSAMAAGSHERWVLEAMLTTYSPLHVGNGESRRVAPPDQSGEADCGEVALVVTDADGRSYLPGSTIKGAVRDLLERRGCPDDVLAALLGSRSQEGDGGSGGVVEFWDARISRTLPTEQHHVVSWNFERQTGIAASVVIDRATNTAAQGLLRQCEYVPAGVGFRYIITGEQCSDEAIAWLVEALRHIRLGAGQDNGWGRMWLEEASLGIKTVQPAQVEAGKMWWECLQDVSSERKSAMLRSPGKSPAGNWLDMTMCLAFEGFLLIKDALPSRTGQPDHQQMRNPDGSFQLPPRSLRGPLRAQAERIVRTLGGRACRPEKAPCPAVKNIEDQPKLCPVCRVFGAGGWASVLAFDEICLSGVEKPREFVAIDRFTGGVSGSKKFNSAPLWQPKAEVRLRLDLDRLEFWGLGLLALVFRDLAEGDIRFGMAKRLGFGACDASITACTLHGDGWRGKVAEFQLVGEDGRQWQEDNWHKLVNAAVITLQEFVQQHPETQRLETMQATEAQS